MDGDGRIGIEDISSFPNHVQRGGCGCDLYDLGKRIDIGFQGRLEGIPRTWTGNRRPLQLQVYQDG